MDVDFLVIGSGIAGLSFSLKVAGLGSVCVVTKKEEVDSATNLAQGGIAAVLDGSDSFEEHVRDTLEAGSGLCDEEVVRMVVGGGPERIGELIRLGVDFVRRKDGSLDLGKEGGHSRRRVAHSLDLTGREIERALVESVGSCRGVKVFENHMCADLIMSEGGRGRKCVGASVVGENGELRDIYAKNTVLCTGGVGKVYLYTSNPDIATGDGIAVAHRVGAEISDMEFVQFHPTCLYHPKAKNFLISEAVRGEGAILVNEAKERFMVKYEPNRMELATRDKVARAIDKEMKTSGADCVYLDISHKDSFYIRERFPNIFTKCLSFGIDITKDPIPVVPAAHYLCGGVRTDMCGRTTVENLFALGETACTGLHGGNRLASNSLLEAIVYAENAFQYCSKNQNWRAGGKLRSILDTVVKKEDIDEEILINHNWDVIRRTMWNYVGIVRKTSRLMVAKQRIADVRQEIDDILQKYNITTNMLELRNISLVASLIIEAALNRKESVGLHYILDSQETI
ncbi:MAG: L-aspartate oxidase [Proteobacteria bacterium]|nr:L-aspartate oxidase [Pseudomonadota bacterium]